MFTVALIFATSASAQLIPPEDDFRDDCRDPKIKFYGENDSLVKELNSTQLEESVKRFRRGDEPNLTSVTRIEVEGCQCFYLHEGRGFKGGSVYIEPGKRIDRDDVHFNKVMSVKKVECYARASPYAVVIGVVVAVVLVVAITAVVGFRLYRSKVYGDREKVATMTENI